MVNRKIKLLIPKDRGELIPIFFVVFLISVYVIFELYVILPVIYNNVFTYKEICHLIFGLYVIYNLVGNLLLCMITDTSIDTVICPFLLPAETATAPASLSTAERELISKHCNWHYCYQCELNAPPRSQHCHLCKKCILKRDHHCSFLGRCIGFRNLRYYMCFLIWTWIGLIYCNILHVDYTYELVGTFSWRVIVACLFPFGAWLFRILDHFSLLLSFICSTSLVLSLYVSFLTFQQIYLINQGQTWHEYLKHINVYKNDKSFTKNMNIVIGKRWYLVLFSPLISTTPSGDGMTFDFTRIESSNVEYRMESKRI